MPIPLTSRSSPLGTSRTPRAPTMGSSVVIVMAEFCQVIGPSLLAYGLMMKTVNKITPANSPTAYHCTFGLDRAKPATEQLHRAAGAVHDAVDHVPVEPRHQR